MNDFIDAINFKDLGSYDPEDVVKRTGCKYDKFKKQYTVEIWGHNYLVNPDQCQILPQTEGLSTYRDFLYLFILFYLMKSKNLPVSGQWVSEKDIVGGAAFFRGPHAIPVDAVAKSFANDLIKFKKRCEELNGLPINMADAAYYFQIAHNIPVAVLYWLGDDDFDSEVKLLFDKTIEQHFALDIILALAVAICYNIKAI